MASWPVYQVGIGGIVTRVLRQHRHERVDVAALPGVHVAADQLGQARVAERA
jgi:hypothetical protein